MAVAVEVAGRDIGFAEILKPHTSGKVAGTVVEVDIAVVVVVAGSDQIQMAVTVEIACSDGVVRIGRSDGRRYRVERAEAVVHIDGVLPCSGTHGQVEAAVAVEVAPRDAVGGGVGCAEGAPGREAAPAGARGGVELPDRRQDVRPGDVGDGRDGGRPHQFAGEECRGRRHGHFTACDDGRRHDFAALCAVHADGAAGHRARIERDAVGQRHAGGERRIECVGRRAVRGEQPALDGEDVVLRRCAVARRRRQREDVESGLQRADAAGAGAVRQRGADVGGRAGDDDRSGGVRHAGGVGPRRRVDDGQQFSSAQRQRAEARIRRVEIDQDLPVAGDGKIEIAVAVDVSPCAAVCRVLDRTV